MDKSFGRYEPLESMEYRDLVSSSTCSYFSLKYFCSSDFFKVVGFPPLFEMALPRERVDLASPNRLLLSFLAYDFESSLRLTTPVFLMLSLMASPKS